MPIERKDLEKSSSPVKSWEHLLMVIFNGFSETADIIFMFCVFDKFRSSWYLMIFALQKMTNLVLKAMSNNTLNPWRHKQDAFSMYMYIVDVFNIVECFCYSFNMYNVNWYIFIIIEHCQYYTVPSPLHVTINTLYVL